MQAELEALRKERRILQTDLCSYEQKNRDLQNLVDNFRSKQHQLTSQVLNTADDLKWGKNVFTFSETSTSEEDTTF